MKISFRQALASPVQFYDHILTGADDDFESQMIRVLIDYKQGRQQQAYKRYENLLDTLNIPKNILLIDQLELLDEKKACLLLFELLFSFKYNVNLSQKQLWKYVNSISVFDPDDVICHGAIYNLMIVFFLRFTNLAAAFELANMALKAYEYCDSHYLQLFVYLHMAYIHVYAGRLDEALEALEQARKQLDLCGRPVCENAMIEITQHWVIAERDNIFPSSQDLEPLSKEIMSGEFWPETFLVMASLQFRTAILEGNQHILESHSGFELILRTRGMAQLLPAMQLLREEFLLDNKYLQTKQQLELSERHVVLLLPTTKMWQINTGDKPLPKPNLLRVQAVADLLEAKQAYKSGRFNLAINSFKLAFENIKAHSWNYLLIAERDFINEICKECRVRGRFVQIARDCQNLLPVIMSSKTKYNNNQFGLTASELGVLNRLNGASSNKEIAREIGISESTVKFHLKNIYKKLSAENRNDALNIASEKGLI
ncbi:MAG: LuxR family transcriptional regulator [Rhizobiales bacterium]|nr:LuxR family transcriptional regulator [Hyphomicrobiales bacterium]NRB15587.1 LuxR family transcriptional regulator [Hyphomicrobiales bacterium]